jgi:hypothetical protein
MNSFNGDLTPIAHHLTRHEPMQCIMLKYTSDHKNLLLNYRWN